MKKINFEKNTYFIGTDGSVYMEMQNIKEFIDEDNIKRYVVHLKDELKISKIKNENMLECKKKNIFDDRNNKGFVDFLKVELFLSFSTFL
jgi:hypothetical protein